MASWSDTVAGAPAPAVRARVWLERIPAAAWVGGIVAVAAVARFLLALTSSTPWIVPDELIYGQLSRSFADNAHFVVRGEPFSALSFGPAYPVLMAPAFMLTATVHDAYVVVEAINSLLFSLAAVPAYLIARRYLTARIALVCAAFTVLVPSGVYTSKIMTESLAYPVFLFAVLALIRAVERPSASGDLVALAAIAGAVLTRAQMVVLFPALLSAIVVVGLVDASEPRLSPGRRSARQLVRHRTLAAVSAVGVILAGVATIASGRLASAALGDHAKLFDRFRPLGLPQWFAYHLADLELYCGVIPVIAFVLVTREALRSSSSLPRLRPFAAVTASVGVWLLLLIGLYGTQRRPSPHVFDRYVFYLIPFFVIGMAVWLTAGKPGSVSFRRLTFVAFCALPLVLPLPILLEGPWGTSSSTVGLLPWVVVGKFVGHGWLLKIAILAFCVSLAAVVLRPERARADRVLRIVALNLLAITLLATLGNSAVGDIARGYSGNAEISWIDAATGPGAHVTALWEGYAKRGERGAYAIWENEIFSRNLDRVVVLKEPLPDQLAYSQASVRRNVLVDSRGKPMRVSFLLTDRRLRVSGPVVASDPGSGLVLRRIDGIARIRTQLPGGLAQTRP